MICCPELWQYKLLRYVNTPCNSCQLWGVWRISDTRPRSVLSHAWRRLSAVICDAARWPLVMCLAVCLQCVASPGSREWINSERGPSVDTREDKSCCASVDCCHALADHDFIFFGGAVRAAGHTSAVRAGLRARYPRGRGVLRGRIYPNMRGGVGWAEWYSCGAGACSGFSARAMSLKMCTLALPISWWNSW